MWSLRENAYLREYIGVNEDVHSASRHREARNTELAGHPKEMLNTPGHKSALASHELSFKSGSVLMHLCNLDPKNEDVNRTGMLPKTWQLTSIL